MVELSNTGAYLVNGSELVFDTPENAARISGECAIGKEEYNCLWDFRITQYIRQHG